MKNYLTQKERDYIMSSLSTEQREFIMDRVKRGKRTNFANSMAKDKGLVISEEMTLEQVEDILDEWILVEYLDGGSDYRNLPEPLCCECGKILRYQYVVKHKKTQESKKFGITHFEEHTGIPPKIIREIVRGFEKIDYELDELLVKLRDNWTLKFNIPNEFDVPEEFQKHFDLGLPLLERQIKRLEEKIEEYLSSLRRQNFINFYKDMNFQQASISTKTDNKDIKKPFSFELAPKHVQAIKELLKSGISSAVAISNLLIEKYEAPNVYDSSGKPRIYAHITLYLDSLVQQGFCSLIRKDFSDRMYIVRGHHQEYTKREDAESCCVCGKLVSEKVKNYCLNNNKFKGKIYCYDHQKLYGKL